MLCPYCGSQNPDDAPLCSSCNAVLKEGAQPPAPPATANPNAPASFAPGAAASAGTTYAPNPNVPAGAPYAPGPYGGAGAPPAPYAGGAQAPKKGGKGKMILLIVLGAVALIGIIIAIVALVTCSGNSGKPNLDSLVKDEPEKVAKYIENFEVVKLYGSAYYTPEDMKDLISKAEKAFDDGSRNAANKVADDIKEQSPWAIAFCQEERTSGEDNYRDFKNLKLVNIKDNGNPSEAIYLTYRTLDDPTPEDVYKIAQEVTEIKELTIGTDPTNDAQKYYGENVYYVGTGEGNGTELYVRVDKLDNVYEIMVRTFNSDEIEGKGVKYIDNTRQNFDTYFKDEATFPAKK